MKVNETIVICGYFLGYGPLARRSYHMTMVLLQSRAPDQRNVLLSQLFKALEPVISSSTGRFQI